MKWSEAMVAWNPRGDIRVGPWPDRSGWSQGLRCSEGACRSSNRKASKRDRQLNVLAEFHTIVVRDGVDVQQAHREFCKISDYRSIIAPDTPGADF